MSGYDKKRRCFIVSAQRPAVCTYCGKTDELRPYGPNGAPICFECARAPALREVVERNMRRAMEGEGSETTLEAELKRATEGEGSR